MNGIFVIFFTERVIFSVRKPANAGSTLGVKYSVRTQRVSFF